MRKKRLFGLLSVLGMAAVLVSCTQDEIEQKSAQRQTAAQNTIGISVVDGLFHGESSTRAIVGGLDDPDDPESFNEYRTTFEAGDAIGVFDVDKDGKIVRSNVKYVCNGTRWNIDDDATEPVEFYDDHSYYAYYPYMPDLKSNDPDKEGDDKTVELDPDGKIAENSTVTAGAEAGEFFKDVTANWVVLDNQGGETLIDKAGYVLSDLMVAKGVRTEGADKYTIEFKMKHQMGLVMLSFGVMERVVDSQIKWNEPVTQTFKGTTRPYVVQGKARYIVNPAAATPKLITASDDTWKQTVFVKERGHYQEYRIEGSKGYTLEVGDVVWTDGSFSKTVEYDKFYNKRPMGIIAYLGNDDVVDNITDANGKRRYSHGIIMGTYAVQGQFANTLYDHYTLCPEYFVNCGRYSLCHYDYGGLEKTRWMQSRNTEEAIKYPVANYVKKYSDTHPVPEYNNSGWYIGSVGQWEGVMKQLANSNINYANVNNEIGGVVGNIKWDWVTKFRGRINKVGNEYFWPRNTDASYPVDIKNYHYIITSSVQSSGKSVTIYANNEQYEANRFFIYSARSMNDNTNLSFTYPLISF
ncbi:MAG: hypothetical protein II854_03960 [Prevotella sp.]|nr:hypothetical protein [Prevotella sp.]